MISSQNDEIEFIKKNGVTYSRIVVRCNDCDNFIIVNTNRAGELVTIHNCLQKAFL